MHLDERPILLSIFNGNKKVTTIDCMENIEYSEENIKKVGKFMGEISKSKVLSFTINTPAIVGLDESKAIDNYSIQIPIIVQKRKHKKKRINKKWAKKYGYEQKYVLHNGYKLNSCGNGIYEFVK